MSFSQSLDGKIVHQNLKQLNIRARGADFQVGGLTRTRKREPTGGSGGMLPRENLKYG